MGQGKKESRFSDESHGRESSLPTGSSRKSAPFPDEPTTADYSDTQLRIRKPPTTLTEAEQLMESGTGLLTAKQVAAILQVPVKRVYELPIPQTRISSRTIRWFVADVAEFTITRRNGGQNS